jgi:DNA-binding response OmpR family regulator
MTTPSPTPRTFTILSVSRDAGLLASRNAVLRQAGYGVLTTMDDDEALALARDGNPDAVVLGDSIALEKRNYLASAIKALNPRIHVLVIRLSGEPVPEDCLTMNSLDGPHVLLTKLSDALRGGEANAA